MQLTITVDLNNEAFEGDYTSELATILNAISNKIVNGETSFKVFDSNGNTCGAVAIKEGL